MQDPLTGEVRMVGHLSREALAATLRTRLVTFFSRSRNRLWVKGESSGHHLSLHRALADCDGDALLLFAEPHGPTCHTGRDACFFRDLEGPDHPAAPGEGQGQLEGPIEGRGEGQGQLEGRGGGEGEDRSEGGGPEPGEASESAAPFLVALERALERRRDADAGRSYTKSLLDAGPRRIGEKIIEEAGELARALESEDDERVASEAADLLYHALVGLIARRVPLRAVLATLARRVGTSGHDEKRARSAGPGTEPNASLEQSLSSTTRHGQAGRERLSQGARAPRSLPDARPVRAPIGFCYPSRAQSGRRSASATRCAPVTDADRFRYPMRARHGRRSVSASAPQRAQPKTDDTGPNTVAETQAQRAK